MLPPRLRRPLAAAWISLGLHAALLALVQVAPPSSPGSGDQVIEARLVPAHAAPVAAEAPTPTGGVATPAAAPADKPQLAPSMVAEAVPVAAPLSTAPPAPVESPIAAAARPAEPASATQPASAPPAASDSPMAITSAVDLAYYSVRDLDVQPRALREIVPEYPYDADRQHLSGQVRVQLKLEADGRVSDLEVVSASPPGVFESSTLKALRTARFAPARKDGRPVRARMVITVEYDWEGRPR
jgi:protein TonB